MNCKNCKEKSYDSQDYASNYMWFCRRYGRHVFYALENCVTVDKKADLEALKHCGFRVELKEEP